MSTVAATSGGALPCLEKGGDLQWKSSHELLYINVNINSVKDSFERCRVQSSIKQEGLPWSRFVVALLHKVPRSKIATEQYIRYTYNQPVVWNRFKFIARHAADRAIGLVHIHDFYWSIFNYFITGRLNSCTPRNRTEALQELLLSALIARGSSWRNLVSTGSHCFNLDVVNENRCRVEGGAGFLYEPYLPLHKFTVATPPLQL